MLCFKYRRKSKAILDVSELCVCKFCELKLFRVKYTRHEVQILCKMHIFHYNNNIILHSKYLLLHFYTPHSSTYKINQKPWTTDKLKVS